jgi:hypothetical protein
MRLSLDDQAQAMQTIVGTFAGSDQRTAPRTDVYARIPATLPDGRQVTVTLVNISADGMLFRFDGQVEADAVMHASLPVIGRIDGRTVWSLGGRTGINFIERIQEQDYVPLLRALGVKITD